MRSKKMTLFRSVIALLLCVSMLVGTTFAWFTDVVTTGINTIAAGNLDVELYHSNAAVTDEKVKRDTDLFLDLQGDPILWEPGVVSYENLRIANEGDLALAYQLSMNTANENFVLDPSGAQYGLSQILKVGFVEGGITATDRQSVVASVEAAHWTTMADFLRSGKLLPENAGESEQVWGIVIYWQPGDNDNLWNLNNGKQLSEGDTLQIDLGINLIATQEGHEFDSFGNDYDVPAKESLFSGFIGGSASATVETNAQNQTTAAVELVSGKIKASVPAGVQMAAGASSLDMTVDAMSGTGSNVTLAENEEMLSLDVHIAGVDSTNTQPITVTLEEVAPKGLNMGNYKLYHVENGTTNEMTLMASDAAFTAHNQFKYDPATGTIVLYMATFSEVAVVAEPPQWKGEFDYTWYTNAVAPVDGESVTEYIIANADQLAGFGAIVGGMNGKTADSFKGQTIKLIADIDLDDGEESNKSFIFYPIGYYNSEGTYERTKTAITSGLRNFEGTFDGNGHTIANFYQNTWEMKGDHDWYTPEEQYYRDGMGLFGKVYGGTVKNLTVRNFKSDGEIATTGVIAAYADGATFENITIFDCNPRVYNIGNGGIVGCVGWYAKEADLKTTFTNITVDNSNKISALWGSYDVACGGIVGQYYPTSGQTSAGTPKNGGIDLVNCHVSAIMDVYNDVCANYQYYAYRYAGMIIGSIRENTTTTIDGVTKTIPDMTGISATGCTVNYGDWNDYYYCEFEKNGHPSYSGANDYKFSRVPDSELKFTDSNNNGVVDADERASVTGCTHSHTAAEDNQAIYLPFHQLFTGYGWGVNSIGLEKYSGIATNLDIAEGENESSVDKFAANSNIDLSAIKVGDEVSVGALFTALNDAKVAIKNDSIVVSVTDLTNTGVTADFTRGESWDQGKLKFNGTNGIVKITIQDYYFCNPTSVVVEVGDFKTTDRFEKKFKNESFTYRVGNQNAFKVENLIGLAPGVTAEDIGDLTVTVTAKNAGELSVVTADASSWDADKIQFARDFTGRVTVTITDDNYSTPVELELEVVEATNVTTATSATANSVVLLNDCGFSSLEVSGGYALYGNGFTMTCTSDSAALDTGYAFVTLNNGTLDNVQIVCPNFDYAVLYKTNMTESGNRKETTDRTRYFNVKSGVMVSGNSQILNSRVSGARAAVNVTGGNCLIDNSRIELGAVASILVGSANSLTLRDVTLIQKPAVATSDSSKTLMGFSVLVVCDANGDSTPITLEGQLIQNAWANAGHKQYVPSSGQDIVSNALKKTDFLHDIDGDGTNESLNLGFAYMPESAGGPVNQTTISNNDNRTNKEQVPYEIVEVSLGLTAAHTYVYSYKNTKGTDSNIKDENQYEPDAYGDIIDVTYSDTREGLTLGKIFGTNGWVYELNVDLDKLSGYKLDFNELSMSINGVEVTEFKVNGSAKPTSTVAVTAGGTTYKLTATVNGKEYTANFKVIGTETSKESPSKISGPTAAGFGVAKSYGGDWSGAADVLTGVKIKYWSVAENKYVEYDFSNFTVPGNAGKLNGTNNYWEYTPTNNDFTLKVTNTVAIHSGKSVYGMPIRGTDGKLYFTISSTNGYVGSGTTSRSITMQYEFTDNNGGDKLTFTHTFNISYNKDNQYSYSDLSGSGKLTKLENSSGGGGCVTPDTLITLADGSQVRVDSLKGDEKLLIWNLETGKYESANIVFVDNDAEEEFEIIHLYFSDGSDVKVIYEHGFFDLDLGKYVYIDAWNYTNYIGHRFVAEGDIAANDWKVVSLDEVIIETEVTTAWSPVTFEHLCYYTNGVLSMPGGIEGLFNIFEVDIDLMRYDAAKMQKDIETYGLFTIEDFGGMITEDAFNAFNGAYLKVAMGKGLLTWEDIAYMAERYIPLM